MLPEPHRQRLGDALALIARTPGYADEARALADWQEAGRIRFVPDLTDRAHAGLLGAITLGPEAFDGTALSLAQTLIHEHWHIARQSPLQKTPSFWAGVATGTPVMARYERPAYRAAPAFLDTVAAALPEWEAAARAEAREVAQTFAHHYRIAL